MPRFATKPEVFPPIVPAVNDRGDVPTYAFCDNGIVLAWTEPDDFLPEQEGRSLTYEIAPEKCLAVGVRAYFDRPTKSAHERALEAAREEIERLRWSSAHAGVVTNRVDRVAPLIVEGVEGLWQIDSFDLIGEKVRPHDSTIRREHVFLPYAISPTKSKLVTLGAIVPHRVIDYPVADAIARWKGAFTARVSAPDACEYAAWYFDLGFLLSGVISGPGSRPYSDAGYIGEDEDMLGGDAKVEVLPPQRRVVLDVERDLAESLRRVPYEVRFPTTIDVVSREVRCEGSGLTVVGGYEIVAGPEDESKTRFDDEVAPNDAEMSDEERRERDSEFHPGATTRVAYLALDDDWYTRLTLTVGARATDRLEPWWQQLCARLWVWVP
jgi:hypothetical protein